MKTKYNWLTKEFLEEQVYKLGKTLKQVARENNISTGSITYYAKNIKFKNRTKAEANKHCFSKNLKKELFIKFYEEENKSILEISKLLNVSTATVFKYLKKYNIEIKQRGKCYKVWNTGKRYHRLNINKDELYKEYVINKKGMRKIGKNFGCGENTIRQFLLTYNIPIKKKNESKWKSEYKCDECGKIYKSYKCVKRNKHNFCSNKCYLKSNLHKMENHCCWLGGLSFEPYSTDWTNKLKQKIKLRDGNKCRLCFGKKKLAVHHIDYDKKNCDESNLVALCNKCHPKTNYDREFWTLYFKEVYSLFIYN